MKATEQAPGALPSTFAEPVAWKHWAILDAALNSFLAALAGEVAAFVLLVSVGWPGAALVGIVFSAPLVFLVWFSLLWPLYLTVPKSSVLWVPWVCVSCGIVAGELLLIYLFHTDGGGSGFLTHFPFCVLGSLVGGVTCAVGCRRKASEPASMPMHPMAAWVYRRTAKFGRTGRKAIRGLRRKIEEAAGQ